MIPSTKFLPLVVQLGTYLKQGLDHYAQLQRLGEEAGPDVIAAYLALQMESWDPMLAGKKLLDPDTRYAAARFLAGVAVNFSGA